MRAGAELRERYQAAGKKERGELLDAFCLATGYERKYAVKVRGGRRRPGRARHRRVRYGPEFERVLKTAREAAGNICAERLNPFLPDLVVLLCRHGQLKVGENTQQLLAQVSIATIDRHLRPLRRGLLARRMSQTKPGTVLRKEVPVVWANGRSPMYPATWRSTWSPTAARSPPGSGPGL